MTVRMKSWIDSANDSECDFTLANLPLGVIAGKGDESARIAVPIGSLVMDLRSAASQDLLRGLEPEDLCALHSETLNQFAGRGRSAGQRLRNALQELVAEGNEAGEAAVEAAGVLSPRSEEVSLLPFHVGDYTDFYASKHHASNVGRMFRPDGDPLLPNWKHLPVGYHGRASSIITSGTPVRRPHGQTIGADGVTTSHSPCRLLDHELEVGFFIGAGSELGNPIPIEEALDHVTGLVLVNDWSARDI